MKLPLRLPRINLLESRKARIIVRILTVLFLLLMAGVILIDHTITPVALSMAQARVRAIASDAIYTAVQSSIRDVAYDDLIIIRYDSLGRVSTVQADSVRMNQIASQTALEAQQQIGQIDMKTVSVPIGTVLGGPVLSGRGPQLPVRVVPAGSVVTEFATSFTSAGVNQTRHEIYLQLRARMRIVIPIGSDDIEVTMRVPVAETVIVGQVPETFLYTDDTGDMLNLVP